MPRHPQAWILGVLVALVASACASTPATNSTPPTATTTPTPSQTSATAATPSTSPTPTAPATPFLSKIPAGYRLPHEGKEGWVTFKSGSKSLPEPTVIGSAPLRGSLIQDARRVDWAEEDEAFSEEGIMLAATEEAARQLVTRIRKEAGRASADEVHTHSLSVGDEAAAIGINGTGFEIVGFAVIGFARQGRVVGWFRYGGEGQDRDPVDAAARKSAQRDLEKIVGSLCDRPGVRC